MATTYLEQNEPPKDLLSRWLARAYTVNWELVAYVVIFGLAIATRFINLGVRVMSHDESLHTYYSWRLATAGDYQHTPLMHGPILFHVTAFFYWLFGDTDFTARLYAAILGVCMVMIPLLFRRWLGRWGALLASIMILASPLLMYYNRYIREDNPSIVSAVLMVFAIFMYIDGPEHLKRRARWLYLLAAALIWCLGSKESAFMYVAIFGSIVTVYWGVRLYQQFWRKPGRNLFNLLIVGSLVGGLAALGMYMVFSIALSNYTTLSEQVTYLGQQFQALFTGQPTAYEFQIFVSWTLIVVGVIIAIVIGSAVWTVSHSQKRLKLLDVVALLLITLAMSLALIAFGELTQAPKVSPDVATETVTTAGISYLPIIAAWVIALVGLAALAFLRASGWLRKLYRFPELDVLIVLGTLILPWLTAFVIKATGASPTDYSTEGIHRAVLAVIPFLLLSTISGLVWNWKRWIICALVFYIPFAFFFTTMFTNPNGLATGMIGSLGYWLEQQGVQRGSQPRYYYALVIMPVYEYLPVIGAFIAMLAGMTHFWRRRLVEPKAEAVLAVESAEFAPMPEPEMIEEATPLRESPNYLKRLPFLLFVAWWGVFNFIAYTLAGEKMPWLGTHLTWPFILLTAWYFGTVFQNADWSAFRKRGWLYLILLPLFGIAVFQALEPFLVGASPFEGLQRQQLNDFYKWLAVVGVAVLVVYLIIQVARRTGLLHLRRMIGVAAFMVLLLLTFRTALMASFINYNYANEYLVYAHGAPGIKLMMQQLDDISQRTTDGMNIKFAWGGNAWPVTWYFRHFTNATFFAGNPTPQALNDAVAVYASDDINSRVEPLLEDRYYKFEYIRMWWPDQDYFYLTAQRVTNALDFSPSNTQAGQIRRGMFNIWWNRDYTVYGQVNGKDYSLQNWPVSERFFLYVRKDVAAQVWNLGTGTGTVMNPLQNQSVNVCTSNWQQNYATSIMGEAQGVQLNHPLDVTVDDAANRVYVAEEFNNRVSVFDKSGNLITTIQGSSSGASQPFNRPNGVAVAPNGNVYIADTWNYQIHEVDKDGNPITTWGQAGQFGANAPTEPVDGFWGPRDVAVDAQGRVYVSDTGNKRVRVYDANGQFLFDIGKGGSALGELDEPSGLAIDNNAGLLYVADTWNRRVSVFTLTGTPQFTFAVRGWYEDQGNRPYLAIDQTRHLLYVTDPDAGRVLVYDLQGNCVGSFGQPSDKAVDKSQFQTIGGIAVDAEGNVYVSDAAAGRVMKFTPFVDKVMPEATQQVLPGGDSQPQATQEATQEATSAIAG